MEQGERRDRSLRPTTARRGRIRRDRAQSGARAADAGAAISVVGRSEEKLAEVLATAGSGTAIAADVRDPERCTALVEEAVAAMGGLDAVVVSSAVSPLAPLDKVSAATWHDVMTTNAIARRSSRKRRSTTSPTTA